MSHEFDTGFTVREPAWHGLANVLDEYPESIQAAREAAGLTWEPETTPVYVEQPNYELTAEGVTASSTYAPLGSWKAVRRNDNKHVLAVTSDTFTVIGNGEMFELAEALLDADSKVRYETAGALKKGALVWALLRLDEPITIDGDPRSATYPYLSILNAHDGSAALRAIKTNIRIVCWNTWQMAERDGEVYTFRHTKNVRDRIEDAKAAIAGLRQDATVYKDFMERLLGMPVTAAQRERFIVEFVPEPPSAIVSDRVMSNINDARQAIRDILASPTTRDTAHTAYGLVQAAGEYLDHVRGWRNRSTYLSRTLLRREPLKAKAAKLALEVARA